MKPCNCGHGKASASQQQQGRAMEFLQGLHHRYSMLRSQILLMDSFPNTIRIYALVRQEEKQQEIHFMSPPVNAPEAAALLVNSAPFNAGNSSSSRANGNNHSSNRSNNNQRNNGRDNCAMVKQICIVITVVTTTTQKMCATSCMVFPMIDQEIHPEIRIFLSVL